MLNKISKILYLVAGFVSIAATVAYITLGVMFVVFGTSGDVQYYLVQNFENGSLTLIDANLTIEQNAEFVMLFFLTSGITFLVLSVFVIVNIVLTFVARRETNRKLDILNIVFGLLSGVEINIAAAILSLIASRNE